MRIQVHSDSAAVTRALQAMIEAAGHQLALASEEADLAIRDAQHPPQQAPTLARQHLTLVSTPPTNETELQCPLRPHQLIQRLAMASQIQAINLGQGWSLNPLSRSLHHPDTAPIPLTEKEATLLKFLAIAPAKALSREHLLESVWGVAGDVDTHTLETHIYRLRAKLEELIPSPGTILTENGAYKLAF